MTPVSHGKPCAGNPHARFDEGASASEEPRRNALLHRGNLNSCLLALCVSAAFLGVMFYRYETGSCKNRAEIHYGGNLRTTTESRSAYITDVGRNPNVGLTSERPPLDEFVSTSRIPAEATASSLAVLMQDKSDANTSAAQQASDMNDVMDEMLNRSEIPADYAETMVALFRDKSQGDVIRDFAVQHIGLYAETLQMRGKYDADASESATLRDALWDAAEETRTIVAVAAFRALADMAAFDPRIDVNRLDSRLASCVADSSASAAVRVMAAQLCGERRITSARASLATIAADRRELAPLRLAAANSARLLAE